MIIGIGGVSRAGKSTLADLLSKQLLSRGYDVQIFRQDEFPVDESQLPQIQDRKDWEVPQSIRHNDFYMAIRDQLEHREVIIIEGLFCFYDRRLVREMDKKILVEIDKSTFVKRKLADFRWGGTQEPQWYIEHIWNNYQTYGQPHNLDECYIVDGTKYFNLVELMRYIGL